MLIAQTNATTLTALLVSLCVSLAFVATSVPMRWYLGSHIAVGWTVAVVLAGKSIVRAV